MWAILRNKTLLPRICEDIVREAMEKGWTNLAFACFAFCQFDPALNGWSISDIARFNHRWQEQIHANTVAESEVEREAEIIIELLKKR